MEFQHDGGRRRTAFLERSGRGSEAAPLGDGLGTSDGEVGLLEESDWP